MDEDGFDAWARRIAGDTQRRSLIRFAGGAAGFLFAGGAPGKAAPVCRAVGERCHKERPCCRGAVCRRRRCRCKPGFTNCFGLGGCRDLQTDPTHCGACNIACAAGERCAGGACFTPASQGTCPDSAHTCAGFIDDCNGNPECQCFKTVGGAIRCVQTTPRSACGQCERNADCAAFGSGALCVDLQGCLACIDEPPARRRACAVPCPT